MNNPIQRNNFFVTPKNYEELADMIKDIGTPEEQRLVWLGASMALNMAHELLEKFNKENA